MAELSDLTAIEKQVYGKAGVEVRNRLAKLKGVASPIFLRILEDIAVELGVTNGAMVTAHRNAVQMRMPEIDWPDDFAGQPTVKTETIREVDELLEAAGVTEIDRDEVTGFMETNTEVPDPIG